MKITIENTTKIVTLNDVPARIWEGETESGIKCYCFITRIAIAIDETRDEEFKKELEATRAPSTEMMAYPSRLIL
jgi:hypothetical protein